MERRLLAEEVGQQHQPLRAGPRLLDFEGAQIIFIGARTDPEDAYHIDP
jgi:hypothetical protein